MMILLAILAPLVLGALAAYVVVRLALGLVRLIFVATIGLASVTTPRATVKR